MEEYPSANQPPAPDEPATPPPAQPAAPPPWAHPSPGAATPAESPAGWSYPSYPGVSGPSMPSYPLYPNYPAPPPPPAYPPAGGQPGVPPSMPLPGMASPPGYPAYPIQPGAPMYPGAPPPGYAPYSGYPPYPGYAPYPGMPSMPLPPGAVGMPYPMLRPPAVPLSKRLAFVSKPLSRLVLALLCIAAPVALLLAAAAGVALSRGEWSTGALVAGITSLTLAGLYLIGLAIRVGLGRRARGAILLGSAAVLVLVTLGGRASPFPGRCMASRHRPWRPATIGAAPSTSTSLPASDRRVAATSRAPTTSGVSS